MNTFKMYLVEKPEHGRLVELSVEGGSLMVATGRVNGAPVWELAADRNFWRHIDDQDFWRYADTPKERGFVDASVDVPEGNCRVELLVPDGAVDRFFKYDGINYYWHTPGTDEKKPVKPGDYWRYIQELAPKETLQSAANLILRWGEDKGLFCRDIPYGKMWQSTMPLFNELKKLAGEE